MFRSVVGVLAVIGVAASVVVGVPAASAADDWADVMAERAARADAYQEFMDWQDKANPRDFEPRDMKVAAPSSVISATADADTDVDRAKNTQRYRPNPSAWSDAKARVAAGSGLTANDVAKTGRWAPKLSPKMLLNLTGGSLLASAASGLAWEVRDGVLMPALGIRDGMTEDVYCRALDNFGVTGYAQNVLGDFVGAECAPWQLAQDYAALVGQLQLGAVGTVAGFTFVRTAYEPVADQYLYCYSVSGEWTGGAIGVLHYPSGSMTTMFPPVRETMPSTIQGRRNVNACGLEFPMMHLFPSQYYPELLEVVDGDVVAQMQRTESQERAEWLTRVRCEGGEIREFVSEAFQQEQLGTVAVPQSVALDGCQPVEVEVEMQPEGTGTGTSTDRVKVGGATVPQPVRDWQTNFPNCWDGSCSLDLVKKLGGQMTLDCFEAPDQCLNWHDEVAGGSTDYECRYAQQVVDISECNVYSRVFDRTAVQQGTGYADPKTGQRPGTQTNPQTGTQTPTQTNPGAASSGMSTPVQNPQSNRQCWPQGWAAFNPFEWVLQPVKCALEWAFVPRQQVLRDTQTRLQLAVVNSKPAAIGQTVEAWGAMVPNSSECAGPFVSLSLPLGVQYSGHPVSACEAPASTMATVSRAAISIFVIVLGLIAMTRYVGRTFGYTGFGRSGGDGD